MADEHALSLDQVKQYIWAKYIENDDVEEEIEESRILDFFQQYYSEVSITADEEAFYYGVLMFEKAWEDEEKKEEYFFLAREVFLQHRERTGETDWDAVEDRLTDIEDFFEEQEVDPETLAAKYALPAPPEDQRDELDVLREICPPGMVLVPPSLITLPGFEEPVEVEAFYIDRFPVTVAEFQAFLDATHYRAPKYWEEELFREREQPVVGVSFHDAVKFADWAGKQIPSHEQWIAAARGATDFPYPWGGQMELERVNCVASGENEALLAVGTHPEGGSEVGVEDLLGGVWEWTESWYSGEQEFKIIKGGSYVDPPSLLTIDTILYASPKEKIDNIGFRCMRPA
ncbi:MAG: formylglycine-generating enzyme family protein, partial [Planctomycetota bacterium]